MCHNFQTVKGDTFVFKFDSLPWHLICESVLEYMLFPKTILCETKWENAYFGKLISSINRVHIYRNAIWNDSVGLVILSQDSIVYSNMEDYKTKTKTRIDTAYKWEKMAAAAISTSPDHWQNPNQARTGWADIYLLLPLQCPKCFLCSLLQ